MSSSAREQFIEAGMHLYPQYGYRQLSVRLLAAETGLSSGMFHHLFASKDDFVSELLKQKYSEGFNQLVLNVLPEQGVQQNLRQVKVFIAFFVRDHLDWIHRIFADSTEGVACVLKFVKTHATQHVALVLDLLKHGINQGILVPATLSQHFCYLMSAVQLPMIVGSRLIEAGIAPDIIRSEFEHVLSDEAIRQRIEWALFALFPDNKPQESL